jgi:hypothetical protein
MSAEKRILEISPRDYIHRTFDLSDRLPVLLRNQRRGEALQRISTAVRIAAAQFQDWLHYKNEHDGFDVYLGMNPLKPEAHTRTHQDIQVIKHLYVDVDEGSKSLAALQHSHLVPLPSYVLHTSRDRFQAIWRVEGVTPAQGETLLHALARHFDGDLDVADLRTTLRFPGFANKKCEQDFQVALHTYTGRSYHTRDFRLRTDLLDSGIARWSRSAERISVPREGSQAERDSAYARVALARGFPPEEVTCDIAEFRAQENPHPEEYARHIVAAAQAELKAQTSAHGAGRVAGDQGRERP